MTREETTSLIKKIETFRPSFLVKKDTVYEWFKILEPFDFNDVDKKLDDYFREGNNFGQAPDPYILTRNLTNVADKQKYRNATIRCQLCNCLVSHRDYNTHYDRCSSVDYIYRMSKKFFNKILKKSELMQLPNEKFDKAYWTFCDSLYERMPNGLEKHCLENAILSHRGITPRYGVDDLLEGLSS